MLFRPYLTSSLEIFHASSVESTVVASYLNHLFNSIQFPALQKPSNQEDEIERENFVFPKIIILITIYIYLVFCLLKIFKVVEYNADRWF